jgi:hypothetical protein
MSPRKIMRAVITGLCLCLISFQSLDDLPQEIEEGSFNFFTREQINNLKIPKTDHQLVWPYFDKSHQGFWGISANFSQEVPKIKIEAKPI